MSSGLICPQCHAQETSVKDMRTSPDGDYIRRRRMCRSCKARFTTYERVGTSDGGDIRDNTERAKTALRSALHYLGNVSPSAGT